MIDRSAIDLSGLITNNENGFMIRQRFVIVILNTETSHFSMNGNE